MATSTFKSEAEFERALIAALTENYGWSKEILLHPTEQDLLENWKRILYENNRERTRLNDAPLTDGEMQQILEQIKTLRTPMRLNRFINGKTIQIVRDNPEDHENYGRTISLKIYDRKEIAGGHSRYQIAEQPHFNVRDAVFPPRRGDLMLLINGMPLIHVELKNGVPARNAINQIMNYSNEGVFSGFFSLVQIFVAMNPTETFYFANPGPDGKFNTDFQFHWADANNEPINNWGAIAQQLLSIPRAHQLIGFYTVADDTDHNLKVMRSYQIYASEQVSNRVAKRDWSQPDLRGGFVWHTTGSGKTLTSFKSAHLVAESDDADKVVFLVDRIELGTQSLVEYRGYADDATTVQATENTDILLSKLKSDSADDRLIVTSIQKISRITEERGYKSSDLEKINRKRIVFIIDEAHRDVFGKMMAQIKDTFPNAMLFGFTGTPIFDEIKKKDSVTADVFGQELHRYSIADGIRDKNVLGFDPIMVKVYPDQKVRQQVALMKAKAATEEDALADPAKEEVYLTYMDHTEVPMAGYLTDDGSYVKGIEDFIPTSQYQLEEYQKSIVGHIVENWKLRSRNGRYHAIFATSSIPEAVQYYRLFKAYDLKVAALFDPSLDLAGPPSTMEFKQAAVKEIILDYNARYHQSFDFAHFADYKQDLSFRLAHKKLYSGIVSEPQKQIDLLIVVDQMLTGFDSKWINTLYLDKMLEYERLIQAFSRTNRLDGLTKPHGTIVYYRYPNTMERNVREAFRLYSGDRPFAAFVQHLDQNLKQLNLLFRQISQIFINSGEPDFARLPNEVGAKKEFAKLFRAFQYCLEAAQVQDFSWKKKIYDFTVDDEVSCSIEVAFTKLQYEILLLRYKELRGGSKTNGQELPYDIDVNIIDIPTPPIDRTYMEENFQKFLRELQTGEEVDAIRQELHRNFARLTQAEQKFAEMLLIDIENGAVEIVPDKDFSEYLTEYRDSLRNDRIHKFAVDFGVDEAALREFIDRNLPKDQKRSFGLFDKLKETVEEGKAKDYIERMTGSRPKRIHVKALIDQTLMDFILSCDEDDNPSS